MVVVRSGPRETLSSTNGPHKFRPRREKILSLLPFSLLSAVKTQNIRGREESWMRRMAFQILGTTARALCHCYGSVLPVPVRRNLGIICSREDGPIMPVLA